MVTSHDIVLLGHYKADKNFSVSWRDLEIKMQRFYEFERRKELDSSSVG